MLVFVPSRPTPVILMKVNSLMFANPNLHHHEISTAFKAAAEAAMMTLMMMTVPMMMMIHMVETTTAVISIKELTVVVAMTEAMKLTMHLHRHKNHSH